MELQFPSLFNFLAFFLFFYMLAVIFLNISKAKNNPNLKRLPPGPRPLPIIGNIHQLIGPLLHRRLRDLSQINGPLMHLKLGESHTIVVSSPEMAKEVMKTHDIIFSQRPHLLALETITYNCADIFLAPHGNFWRQLRKICVMELLSAKRVQSFRAIREQEVSAFIKAISLNGGGASTSTPINLSEQLFSLTYATTSRAAFGNKNRDQEQFIRNVAELSNLLGAFCLSDLYPSKKVLKLISKSKSDAEKLLRANDKIFENIIHEHKEKRKETIRSEQVEEDLVDVLLRLQQDGDLEFPLTEVNVKAIIMDVFTAGSETSSTTIEWAMSELLKNPKLMEKAQREVRMVFAGKGRVDESGIAELKFLKSIVKEILRLHGPTPLLLPRECSEDCVISGYHIPAKARVIVNSWAIARDPKYWKEAETFDPERFLDNDQIDFGGTHFEFIPFGGGRRVCPGISFALANIELPLANLLYHFDWKLPNGMKHEDLDMTEAAGVTVRRKNDLLVVPIPYQYRA